MLQIQRQPLHPLILPTFSPFPFSHSLNFPIRTTNPYSLSLRHAQQPTTSIAAAAEPEEGPIELSSSTPSIFASSDDPTLLQTATSVLLTGAITVFLFRSLRRRAKRAKETKFRSSGTTKSLKEEAMESLKAVTLSPVDSKTPSPVQTFLGAVTAAIISVILYKFTTTIEASLNRQTMPDNFSVRQITVTIRTIINGLCYLATFVFGINSLGLFLYSGQLAFNSLMEEDSRSEGEAPISSSDSKLGDLDGSGISEATEDQSSDNTQ
ncbi:hypothetical protein ACJIZ3_011099 [Penstemon smallii]|uniref:Transmembrane protein n=1 Tax=Penstemon smallii TaxID=265156 RepID=A0ABD3ULT7_9LAMI